MGGKNTKIHVVVSGGVVVGVAAHHMGKGSTKLGSIGKGASPMLAPLLKAGSSG